MNCPKCVHESSPRLTRAREMPFLRGGWRTGTLLFASCIRDLGGEGDRPFRDITHGQKKVVDW